MAARPQVTVFNTETGAAVSHIKLPAVFTAPIRTDVVQFVHMNLNKNHRQAYAVSVKAGHQTSAESWGTGRAVARIPRVPGGGTNRSGQGAFGNMCRGGRMFAPTKTWRRWHRQCNVTQKRHAVAAALAASALPSLVEARGHRVSKVAELPLVLSKSVESVAPKTKEALAILARFHADDDVQKVKDSRKIRCGKGKMRNRRYVQRRGPLVVYAENKGLTKAFRNIPGIELCSVDRLNLLQLAPGGHLGRFIIWTQDAFAKLDSIFGTYRAASKQKHGYTLGRSIVTNPDLPRIINSDEIQSVVRAAKPSVRSYVQKKNPLTNRAVLNKLNPYAKTELREAKGAEEKTKKRKAAGKKESAAKRSKQ
jgi:large subunit ribosomal protein L4e